MISAINIRGNQVLEYAPEFAVALVKANGDFSGYGHSKRALGGDWSATFEIHGKADYLAWLANVLLMGEVRVYSDADVIPVWQGFVSATTLETPVGTITRDWANTCNRVVGRYTTSTNNLGATAQQHDAEALAKNSQDVAVSSGTETSVFTADNELKRYGQRDVAVNAGSVPAVGVARKSARRYLNQNKSPNEKPSSVKLTGAPITGQIRLTVRCDGYIKLLSSTWHEDSSIAGATKTIETIMGEVATNHWWFNASRTEANGTLVYARSQDRRYVLDVILDLCRLGDDDFNRWVVYTDYRTLIYEQASSEDWEELKYSVKIVEDFTVIYEKTVGQIPFELVKPNEYVRVDYLSRFASKDQTLEQDPTVTYIEAVTFRDPEELSIAGTRADIFDIAMKRANIGSNSYF